MKQTVIIQLLLFFVCTHIVIAGIPRTIAYQGILIDQNGNPKSDVDYKITFTFYESESGGISIWFQEEILPIRQGMFATFLGQRNPFNDKVRFDCMK